MLSAFEAAHRKYIEETSPTGKHPQSPALIEQAESDYQKQYAELFQLGLLVLRNIDGVTSAHLLKLFPQLTAESLKQAGWSDTPSAMVEVTPTIYGASVKLPWKAKVSALPMVYEVRNLQNEIVQSARETTNGIIDISGLLPETAYQLVVATSIGGASMIRSEQPFKTLTPPPPAPDPTPAVIPSIPLAAPACTLTTSPTDGTGIATCAPVSGANGYVLKDAQGAVVAQNATGYFDGIDGGSYTLYAERNGTLSTTGATVTVRNVVDTIVVPASV